MNENCLRGMKCPKCKSYEPFTIAVRSRVRVFDDGSETIHPEVVDWNEDSERTLSHGLLLVK
jgi:hypothetical protein